MNIIERGMLVYLRLLLVLEFLKINGKISLGARGFSLLQNVQPHSGAHTATFAIGTWGLTWINEAGLLTTHLKLVPKLRMSRSLQEESAPP